MKQNKTYLHLGVTLIVSACAVLMFYDTFFQSRVLLDFFDKLMFSVISAGNGARGRPLPAV